MSSRSEVGFSHHAFCHHGDRGGVQFSLGGRGRGPWGGAVSAVVIGPAGGRGGVRPVVVIFAQRCGVVGGSVNISLLQGRWVEVRPLIWEQVILVQGLEEERRQCHNR